jgi:uncharacterized protein (TIGR01244 family)
MDIRPLTDRYAVAPQILPEDFAALAADGVTTVICNRPDMEVPPELQADAMRAAAEAAGLRFVENPIMGGGLTLEAIETQGTALTEAEGNVLAYCASGTRSAIVWALSQAGQMPTDDIIAATARGGYALDGLAPQIEALAARGAG